MIRKFKLILLASILAVSWTNVRSQTQPTIVQLLDTAKKNYPAILASASLERASEEKVKSTRRLLVPEVSASTYINYVTYNNITGMFFPEYFLPVSGPPSARNLNDMVWGSAAGLLMKWEPYTFGRRNNEIKAAESTHEASTSIKDLTLLEHSVQLSSTYLDYLLAMQILDLLESDQERSRSNYEQAVVLANSGLVSGVDTARFRTELSKVKINILQQQNTIHEYKEKLSELIAADLPENLADSTFLKVLPRLPEVSGVIHPKENLAIAQWNAAQYQFKAEKLSWLPTLSVWGTAYGRGSGVQLDNNGNSFVNNPTDGFNLTRFNYGLGLQLTMPLTQISRYKTQWKAKEWETEAYKQQLEEVRLTLNKQKTIADKALETAMAIARETPYQVEDALYAYEAAQSRYQAGLMSFTELIESQNELITAEIELRKSYWEAWKALLYTAAVNGNLEIFLNQL
ncbi:MAG: TolC family protein [Cyclobacteriaceae bacterium]|uniref:TolC family protein n=1 Tax=Euzebyella marina TaxID=1761453 RepID=A0A3G2L2H8_9FLAO|nr:MULTISPECIES: TolC family protein [Flavobacteriaceae]AYN66464.1 TolC family protein [Euzebyella marina]MCB0497254.1 TolC family protein [Cyclobacteriaceae bacterium]